MEETKKVTDNKSDALQREWARIVAQAWADPDFRKQLEKNPRAVLKQRGIDVPPNVDLDIIEKPLDLQEIERAVRPIDMAVAAGFAAPPMPAPQPNQSCGYSAPFTGMDYSTGYGDPSQGYEGAVDPTLEARARLTPFLKRPYVVPTVFQWGAGQPSPTQQQFPTQQTYPSQQPQAPMPAASYGPPQPQQPPTAAWAGDMYSGAVDPTLEGKGKVGLCFGARCINACLSYQWGAAQPFSAQQQMPQAPYWPPQQQAQQPPATGDIYSSGAVDPTLEGKFKFGLCISTPVAGVCAYLHSGAGQPFPAQQQMPQVPYWPPQVQQPPTAGDIYSSGAVDPTLEGKFKFGLCISTPVAGVCAYLHSGAGQPFPAQQQMPQVPYWPPQVQQPPTAGDIYSSGVVDPTLEGKGKVGLCFGARCINACLSYQWGAAQPFLAQQQMPQAPYWPQQVQQPPTAGDIYSSGAVDPTLEGKFKFGLCISTPVAGVCAYLHSGAGQPFPAQQQQPVAQPPTPAASYGTPAQPQQPTAGWAATVPTQCFSGAAISSFGPGQQPVAQPPTPGASYGTPAQPQQPTAGWAATVPTQCFSGAATPSFVPGGHPSQQPIHILPSPGPQTRPANPGPQLRPANPGSA
jgi:hypothetical protein